MHIFGNGLPDLVQLGGGQPRYWRNLGQGRFAEPRPMSEAPGGLLLADPEVQFMDATGDGKPDLLVSREGLAGYFPLNHNGQWDRQAFRPFKQRPSFSLADPEVKLLDLDGDGVTDMLRNGSRLEYFYHDPEQSFVATQQVNKSQLGSFPSVIRKAASLLVSAATLIAARVRCGPVQSHQPAASNATTNRPQRVSFFMLLQVHEGLTRRSFATSVTPSPMVGSTFILINRNGRRTLLNSAEIASAHIEDIDLKIDRGRHIYGQYSPEQGTIYTVQLMLTSRREMEYIFAMAAERDELYDQLVAAMAPAAFIELTAPFVPVKPDEPATEKKTYTKD